MGARGARVGAGLLSRGPGSLGREPMKTGLAAFTHKVEALVEVRKQFGVQDLRT